MPPNWQAQNATGVNAAIERLGTLLPTVAPGLYPNASRLEWETWYFKSYHMTWVWLIYLMAMVFLLISVVYKWPLARFLGLGTFVLAFGFLSCITLPMGIFLLVNWRKPEVRAYFRGEAPPGSAVPAGKPGDTATGEDPDRSPPNQET